MLSHAISYELHMSGEGRDLDQRLIDTNIFLFS